jgi:hypothetical protein
MQLDWQIPYHHRQQYFAIVNKLRNKHRIQGSRGKKGTGVKILLQDDDRSLSSLDLDICANTGTGTRTGRPKDSAAH